MAGARIRAAMGTTGLAARRSARCAACLSRAVVTGTGSAAAGRRRRSLTSALQVCVLCLGLLCARRAFTAKGAHRHHSRASQQRGRGVGCVCSRFLPPSSPPSNKRHTHTHARAQSRTCTRASTTWWAPAAARCSRTARSSRACATSRREAACLRTRSSRSTRRTSS